MKGQAVKPAWKSAWRVSRMGRDEYYFQYQRPQRHILLTEYVYQIGSYHYNWHPDLELLAIIRGDVEVCADGEVSLLHERDLFLINSNVGHATLSLGTDSVALLLHIDPTFFQDFFPSTQSLIISCRSDDQNRENMVFRQIRSCLADMMLYYGSAPDQQLRYEATFYSLIRILLTDFDVKEEAVVHAQTRISLDKAILKLIQYIDEHYQQRISLEDISRISGYHRIYISQLFKSRMGINFIEYLNRVRLREATAALRMTDDSVTDIALRCGFSDLKSFSNRFRETFCRTPTAYRQSLTEAGKSIDVSFKKQYWPKADESVSAVLRLWVTEGLLMFLDEAADNQAKPAGQITVTPEQLHLIQSVGLELEEKAKILLGIGRHPGL